MAIINRVPLEMWHQIASYLLAVVPEWSYTPTGLRRNEDTRLRDVSSLSRTCKRMQDIFQPILFASFHSRKPPCVQLIRLLRTLRSRSDLAQGFKSLRLEAEVEFGKEMPPAELEYVRDLVTRLRLPQPNGGWKKWEQYPEPDDSLLVVELILLSVPNLTDLKFCITDQFIPTPLPRIFRYVQRHGEFLHQLRSLELEGAWDDDGRRVQVDFDVIGLLVKAAPNIQQLTAHNADPWFESEDGPFGTPDMYPFSNLRDLDLGRTQCSSRQLFNMLASATKLERLRLCWSPYLETSNWGHCEGADGWKAVENTTSTMKHLDLNISGNVEGNPDLIDIEAYENDFVELEAGEVDWRLLSKFEKLEVLRVGQFALEVLVENWRREHPDLDKHGYWESIFPKGIKDLKLDCMDLESLQDLAAVLESGSYPSLRWITVDGMVIRTVEFVGGWGHRLKEAETELKSLFRRRGVVFKVIH